MYASSCRSWWSWVLGVYNPLQIIGWGVYCRYMKHQTNCYRNIKGVEYKNYADLIYSDVENKKVVEEAKAEFSKVRVIKHWTGDFQQVFVANQK